MSAVRPFGPDAFAVELAALERGGLAGWFRPRAVPLDPYRLGLALSRVVTRCELRSAAGRRLLWNRYDLFLRRDDWERVRVHLGRASQDLVQRVLEEVLRLDAELVGPAEVHVLADEADEVPPGTVVVRPRFVEAAAASPDPVATVRLGSAPSAAPALLDDRTIRVAELGPGATVAWDGGQARLALHEQVFLGRPHPGAPARFVPLVGASARVSRVQLWVEVDHEGVRVGRLPEANPVQVDDEALPPGGEVARTGPRVRVLLSAGDLALDIEREDAP